MDCKKCGNRIPSRVRINGSSHVTASRTHCLTCVPWKTKAQPLSVEERKLERRGSVSRWRKRRIEEDGVDPISARAIRKRTFIIGLTNGCQVCRYNRCRDAISFHHLKDKVFHLTVRRFQLGAENLLSELKKCVVLCHICHTEHHAGILENNLSSLNQDFIRALEESADVFRTL